MLADSRASDKQGLGLLINNISHYRLHALLLLGVGVAYSFSLTTLAQMLGLETPLAYLGLIPLVSIVLALSSFSRPERGRREIRDAQVDFLVGVVLLALPVFVMVFLPVQMAPQFWVARYDLLSLPVFVAGGIALLFGVNTLWRLRAAVGVLFLAWPAPYTLVLDRFLELSLEITARGVEFIVVGSGLGTVTDGRVLSVATASGTFSVMLGSVCAGANALAAVVLMFVGLQPVITGTFLRKSVWLVCGVALVYAANVLRVVLILLVGKLFGEEIALGAFHALIGLTLFNLALIIMLVAAGRLGLGARMTARFLQHPEERRTHAPIPSVVVFLLAVAAIGISSREIAAAQTVYSFGDSAPALLDFRTAHPIVPGWDTAYVEDFNWAQQYFGRGSTFERFVYIKPGQPFVWIDVVRTPDRQTLGAFGVENCYSFHGYQLENVERVSLGRSITATILNYRNRDNEEWTGLYWVWPVRKGDHIEYERLVEVMTTSGDVSVEAPSFETPPWQGAVMRLSLALSGPPRASDVGAFRPTNDVLRELAAKIVDGVIARSRSAEAAPSSTQ